MSAAESQLAELSKTLPEKQTAWEQSLLTAAEGDAQPASPIADVHFALDDHGHGKQSSGAEIPGKPEGNVQFDDGVVGKSFKPAKTSWFDYGKTFNFEKDQAFSVAGYILVTPEGGSPFGKMNDGDGARGWDLEFHGLRPSVHLIHRWPNDAIHIQADERTCQPTFSHTSRLRTTDLAKPRV